MLHQDVKDVRSLLQDQLDSVDNDVNDFLWSLVSWLHYCTESRYDVERVQADHRGYDNACKLVKASFQPCPDIFGRPANLYPVNQVQVPELRAHKELEFFMRSQLSEDLAPETHLKFSTISLLF